MLGHPVVPSRDNSTEPVLKNETFSYANLLGFSGGSGRRTIFASFLSVGENVLNSAKLGMRLQHDTWANFLNIEQWYIANAKWNEGEGKMHRFLERN